LGSERRESATSIGPEVPAARFTIPFVIEEGALVPP
jgi:hypothetical protein